MTIPPSPEFSYDLYPGLDADLEAALARNIATGAADPEQVAIAGLASVVGKVINQPRNIELAAEVTEWGNSELLNAGASWMKYVAVLGSLSLNNSNTLRESHKNLDATILRLYEVRNLLLQTSHETTMGTPIGETMKLVLVPWQHFKDQLANKQLRPMLRQMRREQQAGQDDVNDAFLSDIYEGKAIYYDTTMPGSRMTASSYLNMKIAQDGPWGVMLAQTSNEAGTEQFNGKSPDDLTITAHGHDNLRLRQERVDQMGIFEWWALTLQEDPTRLSSQDGSWLLANRLDYNSGSDVPCANWVNGRVNSDLVRADRRTQKIKPRLAVM